MFVFSSILIQVARLLCAGIYHCASVIEEIIIPKEKSPTTKAKKTRIDRSLLFIMLINPVSKDPIPKIQRATKKILSSIEPELNSKTFRILPKSIFSKTKRMTATAMPTDHLPKGVFGRIVIRTFIAPFLLVLVKYYFCYFIPCFSNT